MDMKRKRRKFSSKFKTKVVLEAIKERHNFIRVSREA
jgi:transposase-like protein